MAHPSEFIREAISRQDRQDRQDRIFSTTQVEQSAPWLGNRQPEIDMRTLSPGCGESTSPAHPEPGESLDFTDMLGLDFTSLDFTVPW
ncbi:MAG: hypothetical protein NT159_03385 [Proteobacteria bacterium]|nr:hypothetical protein [Pseudomonadota bacterium]